MYFPWIRLGNDVKDFTLSGWGLSKVAAGSHPLSKKAKMRRLATTNFFIWKAFSLIPKRGKGNLTEHVLFDR